MSFFKVFGSSLSAAALFATANHALAGTPSVYQVSIPEPSVLSLMAGGLATAVLLVRAKRKK